MYELTLQEPHTLLCDRNTDGRSEPFEPAAQTSVSAGSLNPVSVKPLGFSVDLKMSSAFPDSPKQSLVIHQGALTFYRPDVVMSQTLLRGPRWFETLGGVKSHVQLVNYII